MAVDADKPALAEQSDPLKFVKELAMYYMDFLETDFHRHKNPKRSVRLRSADNLLVGINLARYPAFVQASWKVILSGFAKDTLAEIRKGAFRTAFPATLLQLIALESDKISETQMDELRAMAFPVSCRPGPARHLRTRSSRHRALGAGVGTVAAENPQANLEIPYHGPTQRGPAQLCLGPAAVLGDSRVASRRQPRINTPAALIIMRMPWVSRPTSAVLDSEYFASVNQWHHVLFPVSPGRRCNGASMARPPTAWG
jgi:hypothetical protein